MNQFRRTMHLPRRRGPIEREDASWGFIFMIPYICGLMLFIAGPIIGSFLLSFSEWDLVTAPRFVGMANYQNLLNDELFRKSLSNTVYYVAGVVPFEIVLSLGLAIVLNHARRGVILFRTIYFLPVISSTVAVALVWMWIYSPDFGVLNHLLSLLRIPGPNWLVSSKWAMPAVIIMSIWKAIGFNMIIFLAGLQGVPTQLYEAARIDGANSWQTFSKITLPLISPTTFFITVVSIINAFQVFESTYILTKGGPANSTLTIVYYLFNNAFEYFKMGYACSVAYILFLIILVLTLIQLYLQKHWVYY